MKIYRKRFYVAVLQREKLLPECFTIFELRVKGFTFDISSLSKPTNKTWKRAYVYVGYIRKRKKTRVFTILVS
jgi:hypothetical protein